MKQPGLDGRHRDADGTIRRKRSDTLVETLRQELGPDFAPGFRDTDMLGDIRKRTGLESIDQIKRIRR